MPATWYSSINYYTILILLGIVTQFIRAQQSKVEPKPQIVLDKLCIITGHGVNRHSACSRRDKVRKQDPTFAEITSFDKQHTFTFRKNTVSTNFECRASYPVTWTYTNDEWLSRSGGSMLQKFYNDENNYARRAKNISDPATFTYTTTLILSNPPKYVGEYVCQRISENDDFAPVATKMTIFQDRSLKQNAFPLFGKDITVWMKERNDGSILLPCYIFNPNYNVTLWKMVDPENWLVLSVNESVTFYPELGFIFYSEESTRLLSPGIYNCSSAHHHLQIKLKSGKKPEPSAATQMLTSPARFSVTVNHESSHSIITCCSSSTKPPLMKLVHCQNKLHCHKQLKYSPDLVDNLGDFECLYF